ncbi:hypothetical protein Avbf_15029 [Armadillidium vulgare]|nr:hypothetical protein Avbf_15029 [Armadillidium vulgare]
MMLISALEHEDKQIMHSFLFSVYLFVKFFLALHLLHKAFFLLHLFSVTPINNNNMRENEQTREVKQRSKKEQENGRVKSKITVFRP